MKDYRSLAIWQSSHQLTLHVYRVTHGFPREEQFGLTSQLRRASASIAANMLRRQLGAFIRRLKN